MMKSESVVNEEIKDRNEEKVDKDDNSDLIKNDEEMTDSEIESSSVALDGGWGWVILISAFFLIALQMIPTVSYGILFSPLLMGLGVSSATVAWIFNIFSFIFNINCIVAGALCEEFGWRPVAISGGILISLSFITSVFATSPAYLIFTYSILGALGASFTLCTCLFSVSVYFDKRRGFAMGFMTLGNCLGTFIGPQLVRFLQVYYGATGAILIMGAISLHICVLGMLFHPIKWHTKKKSNQSSKDIEIGDHLNIKQIVAQRRRNLLRQCSECSAEIGGSFTDLRNKIKDKDCIHDLEAIDDDLKMKKTVARRKNNLRNSVSKYSECSADLGESFTDLRHKVLEKDIEVTDDLKMQKMIARRKKNIMNSMSKCSECSVDIGGSFTDLRHKAHENEYSHDMEMTDDLKMQLIIERQRRRMMNSISKNSECSVNIGGSYTEIRHKDQDCDHESELSEELIKKKIMARKTRNLIHSTSYYSESSLDLGGSFADLRHKLQEDIINELESEDDNCIQKKLSKALIPKRIALSILTNVASLSSTRVIIIAFVHGFLVLSFIGFQMWIPFALVHAGHSLDLASWAVSLTAITNAAGRVLCSLSSDRKNFNRRAAFAAALMLSALGIFAFTFSHSTVMILSTVSAWAFGVGSGMCLSPVVMIDIVGMEQFPAVFGASSIVAGILFLSGGTLIGVIRDATSSYTIALRVLSAMPFAGCLLFLLMPLAEKFDTKRDAKKISTTQT